MKCWLLIIDTIGLNIYIVYIFDTCRAQCDIPDRCRVACHCWFACMPSDPLKANNSSPSQLCVCESVWTRQIVFGTDYDCQIKSQIGDFRKALVGLHWIPVNIWMFRIDSTRTPEPRTRVCRRKWNACTVYFLFFFSWQTIRKICSNNDEPCPMSLSATHILFSFICRSKPFDDDDT